MIKAVMAYPKNASPLLVSNPITKYKGTFTPNSSRPLKHLFSFSEFGLGIRPPKTILAPFHSISSSTPEPQLSHSRSIFEKITTCNDAFKLFDEMTQRQPLPSVVQFTQLLQALTKAKHYSCSIDIFKQMCRISVPINVYTTTIVIKCCCQLYRTNEGFSILGSCFKRAIEPDVFTFSTLLNGLILENKVLEAERLFKKLIKDELCEPNEVMYNTMIKGLCKIGNNNTAIDLLKLMDERNCKPNVVTYSTIIDSLCKNQMVDEALNFFKEMIFQKGILPDIVTYTSLIHCLCNLYQSDDVSRILKKIEDESIHQNGQTFSILVNAYCKEAMHLFNEIRKNGMKPDVVMYNTILQGLFRVGRCVDADRLFNEMRANENTFDQCTYRIFLKGLCNNREVGKAIDLFCLMSGSKLNLDIKVYNILIDGGSKCGNFEIARVLLSKLIVNGLRPNVRTYTSMISGFCREGLVMDAKKLFFKMEESGCCPNEVTYNVIIQGYLKNEWYDEVEILLKEMDKNHFALCDSVSSLLIDGIVDRSLDKALFKLIKKLVPNDCMNAPFFAG